MDPLEIIRNNADAETLTKVEKLIAEGAVWSWATFTNEAALEGPEDVQGNRTYYVVVDFDEEDFETTAAFETV